MIPWYPAAERLPADDVGPFVQAPERGVLHTTESAHFPTYKPGTHPHFTVWMDDNAKVHVSQHVPITHASAALVHASGQIDTNREGAIQIEIATFAAHVDQTPKALLVAVRTLMRWLEGQTGIKRRTVPFKPYPASYGQNNGVRMTIAEWKAFNGWCGHEHVPENDHGDPGALNMTFLLTDPTVRPAIVYPRLTQGSPKHDWVRRMQTLLNNKGARLVVDGNFGPGTLGAVNKFKAAHHLPVNGVCGLGMWWALTH